MNTLSLMLLGITVAFLLVGVVSGLRHGLIGSILRFGTLVLSFMVAWFCRKPIAEALLSDGGLASGLVDSLGKFGETLMPLLTILLSVIVFVAVFSVLKLVSGIVIAILGVFIPKGAFNLGALFGIVQGALLAFCICVPINGLLLDVDTIIGDISEVEMDGKPLVESLEVDGKPVFDEDEIEELRDNLEEYADSGVSKFYTAIGKGYYKSLRTAKIDGKTIEDYMDAAVGAVKITGELVDLYNMDFSQGLTAENRDALKETFKNLNEIQGDMSDEAQEIVSDLLVTVADMLDASSSEDVKAVLEDIDMKDVDFEKEGDVILKLYDLSDAATENEMSATEIVNTLAESTVVLPVLETMVAKENPVTMPDAETEAEVIAAINNIQQTNPEAAESLRKIFGLQ